MWYLLIPSNKYQNESSVESINFKIRYQVGPGRVPCANIRGPERAEII
jgi:hypothetical protein